MKALKTIEKIFLWVSFVVVVTSFALSALLDEGQSYSGILTGISLIGVVFVLILVTAGVILYDNQNKLVSKIGIAMTVSGHAILLTGSLLIVRGNSVSAFIGLGAVVLYLLSLLMKAISKIVVITKPQIESSDDPDNDPRIKNILKWKNLEKQGIITAEEFESKRVEILGLNKQD